MRFEEEIGDSCFDQKLTGEEKELEVVVVSYGSRWWVVHHCWTLPLLKFLCKKCSLVKVILIYLLSASSMQPAGGPLQGFMNLFYMKFPLFISYQKKHTL